MSNHSLKSEQNQVTTSDHPVLLFDGVCNFCNDTVNAIIKLDKKAVFKFAPLQSDIGQHLLQSFEYSGKDLDTVVFICNGRLHTKSDAVLQAFKYLGGTWHLLRIFAIVPRPVRNAVYNFIAKNRYRWFGKKDACMMPTPDVKARFLA